MAPHLFAVFSVLAISTFGLLAGDVTSDSEIARERMLRLRTGLLAYLNDNNLFPVDPKNLYPQYISDPLDYWHPGDTDSPPTTIDNSTPNAPNSASISYTWFGYSETALDHVLLQDNTPDNNGGLFVNKMLQDGSFETDPLLATTTPTAVALTQARLNRFGHAIATYTNDYEDWLPLDLMQFWQEGTFENAQSFWNPGDDDPTPTDITNSALDAQNSAQVSFEYLGAGFQEDDLGPETVVIRDISASNNGGFGINVLFADRTVRFVPVGTLGDSEGNCHIDLADWSAMQRCFGGPDQPILDNTCRILDFDGNDRLDLADHAAFIATMTGPGQTAPNCSP